MSLQNIKMLKIGKPCAFDPSVDPKHRIGKFLKARMSIIDLIPCHYTMSLSKGTDTSTNSSGIMPQVVYDKSLPEYQEKCKHYGLEPVSALRLYSTDDTTASDSFSNRLKDNYFQSGLNTLYEKFQPIHDFLRAIDNTQVQEILKKQKENIGSTGYGIPDKLINTAYDVLLKGYRISLPSIWSDSTYTPNFQAVIKLASPYGHPKAIKEFIIKPLLHLLILSSPETEDGVSYGNPFCLTIKGYGINYSPIGMISDITLRRGGNDTSFNIFRQPLTIDVSISFNYLVNGFAHYRPGNYEKGLFNEADNFLTDSYDGQNQSSLPTVGHILTSLRPREPEISYTTVHSNMKSSNIGQSDPLAIYSPGPNTSGLFDPLAIYSPGPNTALSQSITINTSSQNVINSLGSDIYDSISTINSDADNIGYA